MTNLAPKSVSIVIEWENAGRIGYDRALAMLDELHRQLVQPTPWTVELIVVYDSHSDVGEHAIADVVFSQGRTWPINVRYCPVPTGDYYELKNCGAAASSADIVIFLDSDVMPSANWLRDLLRPFEDSIIEIVAGDSFVEPENFYAAAFALGWFFPLRDESRTLRSANRFFANNVAFRRELVTRFPFPATGQHRGQCAHLAGVLRKNGHKILFQPLASASHPAPEWFKPFAMRALWTGHDATRVAGGPRFWRGMAGIARGMLSSFASVWLKRRRVGFGVAQAAVATGIFALYHGLTASAFVCTWFVPEWTKRKLELASVSTRQPV